MRYEEGGGVKDDEFFRGVAEACATLHDIYTALKTPGCDGKVRRLSMLENEVRQRASAGCLAPKIVVGSSRWIAERDSRNAIAASRSRIENSAARDAEQDITDVHSCSEECLAAGHKEYLPDFIGDKRIKVKSTGNTRLCKHITVTAEGDCADCGTKAVI